MNAIIGLLIFFLCTPVYPECIPNKVQGFNLGSKHFYEYAHFNTSYNVLTCKDIDLRKGDFLKIWNWNTSFKRILFRNSTIPQLPDKAFINFRNTTELYLNNTKIEVITPGAFKGLVSLQQLYLQDNKMEKITRLDFYFVNRLQVLDLSRNRLSKIEQKSFYWLLFLKELYLPFNQLQEISNSTFRVLVNLKVLDLSHNKLHDIAGDAFVNLHSLQKLLLRHNYLVHGPKSIENLTSLQWLDVSLNEIDEINFNTLSKHLGHLNVSHNNFSSMEDWRWLESIEIADLGNNNFSDNIRVEKGVRFLYLNSNRLCNINSSNFENGIDLIDLDLSENIIEIIDENIFQNLTKLEILTLSRNKLTYLATGAFKNLSSLWKLRLSFNLLTNLEYGTFSGLDNLTVLYLDNNQLEHVHENSFYVLGKLRALYLTNNFLIHLNADELIKQLPNLNTVDLDGNNWLCSSLFRVVRILTNHTIGFYNGSNYYVQNIHGIACTNGEDKENEIDFMYNKDAEGYLKEQPASPKEKELRRRSTNFLQYLDKGFMNSTFYKFFESNYINTGFSKYLQSGFRKTNFFKYFDNDFFNSSFFKYFNEDFRNSAFYKQFKHALFKYGLNKTEEDDRYEKLPTPEAQILIEDDHESDKLQFIGFESKITTFIFINTGILFLVITVFLFVVFRKQKQYRIVSTEETQNEC